MDEQGWATSSDVQAMLAVIAHTATDRKLRLFSCGCCRQVWQLVGERSHFVVEFMESFADGGLPDELRQAESAYARREEEWIFHNYDRDEENPKYLAACSVADLVEQNPFKGAEIVSWVVSHAKERQIGNTSENGDLQSNAPIVREIFGNPFRPVSIDPRWLTASVLDLARAIYDERAFERMPVLADALQDAGCSNDDIINHCRGTGPHVRGCWVVDLVLGKA
jgi:hypothetical protein